MMKRILITGANGLLGQKLASILSQDTKYELLLTSKHNAFVLNHQLFDYTLLDITSKSDVKSLVTSYHPDIIINTAAITDVDRCERERELAWKVNVHGVENLVEAARKVKAKLIQISTDYVFDGKRGPYAEDDRPNPINYYGKTKLASENTVRLGEIRYAIVRTIVLYGHGKNVKSNFALWVINNLQQKKPIRGVTDQIGNPTLANDLAYGIVKIIERDREGFYHICGSEMISRYDFAVKIAQVFGFNPNLITPTASAELQQVAPRPLKSGFITLKSETELGLKPSDVTQGLMILKRELQNSKVELPSRR